MYNRLFKWAVLVSLLLLPFFVYFIFVYSAEENFFQPLAYVGPSEIKKIETAEGIEYDTIPYSVAPWQFTNQLGHTVHSDSLKGKVYLASFFFSRCPSICPSMNFQIRQFQERFGGFDQFRILSFTVDPENDSVAVLKNYARRMNANNDLWYFLTGNRDSLYKTASHYLQSAQEDSTADGGFLHTEQVVLVDWEGCIRSRIDDNGNLVGSYNALDAIEMKDLSSDLKVLIAEYERDKSRKEYKAEKEAKKLKKK